MQGPAKGGPNAEAKWGQRNRKGTVLNMDPVRKRVTAITVGANDECKGDVEQSASSAVERRRSNR